MAAKGAGNIAVTYNNVPITNYLNEVELSATVSELEATHFGSTAEETDPGLASYSVSFNGDWDKALDDLIGVDAPAGTKRTVAVAITDESGDVVTYTWTLEGFVTGYNINASATGKIEHDSTLRLNGVPGRAVS